MICVVVGSRDSTTAVATVINRYYRTDVIVIDDTTPSTAISEALDESWIDYAIATGYNDLDVPVEAIPQRPIVQYARVWQVIMFFVIWRRMIERRSRAPPLQRLTARQLIETPDRGHVRASGILF